MRDMARVLNAALEKLPPLDVAKVYRGARRSSSHAARSLL